MTAPTKSFIAKLVVRPEARETFLAAQIELKRLVAEREPDALVYELLQSADDANVFMCVATFRTAEAFDHHMQVDFHHRLVPPILESLSQEMELTFYESLGWPPKS